MGKDLLVCLCEHIGGGRKRLGRIDLITPTAAAHVLSPLSAREFLSWDERVRERHPFYGPISTERRPPSPKQEFPTASWWEGAVRAASHNAPCVGSLQFDPRTRRSGTAKKPKKKEKEKPKVYACRPRRFEKG